MSKRIVSLIVASILVIFTIGILAGCSVSDKLVLLNSMEKMIKVKSMESKSDITMRVGLRGISEAERNELASGIPIDQSINMRIHQKSWENNNGTVTKSQLNAAFVSGGESTSGSIWSESDVSGDIPIARQIFKLPPEIIEFLPPEYTDRRYMVIDQSEMTGDIDAGEYRKILEAMNNFQPKLINFMKEYVNEFNRDFEIITNRGKQNISGRDLNVYEVRFTDNSLKDFMRYSIENASKSKNLKLFLEEIVELIMSYSGDNETKAEMNSVFDDMRDGSTGFKGDLDKVMNTLQKVRLLGSRGIVINLGIDNDGYMVSQNGFIDLVIDIKAVEGAFMDIQGTAEENIPDMAVPNMVLDFSFDFNTDIYNINKDILIDFPTLTPQNSFSFNDILNIFGPGTDSPIEEEETVGVIVDNEWTNIYPLMLGEIPLVPVSDISRVLGAKIIPENNTVRVTKNGTIIVFVEGESYAEVNGNTLEMEFPAGELIDEFYVPLEFLVRNLKDEMYYNEAGNIVIKTK